MSARRIYLDRGVGEARGVITLDGQPERLILRRDGDEPKLTLGARSVARVQTVEPALATAFLDLGGGAEAILPFKADSRPVRGEAIEIEIRAEPRRGKLAIARHLGPAAGDPRLISGPKDLADELRALVRGVELVEGRAAREAADDAQAEALEVLHPIPGGGVLAVEPTRALTAVDVDLGERKGADAKRVTRQANLAAIGLAARLLRLKGLGGIVVLDLVGRGHDGAALLAAARAAFAPDNPGVAIGPVGRFGTMELALPRRIQPLSERLCREDGRLNDLTLALQLVRELEREGEADRAARFDVRCAPSLAGVAQPLVQRLGQRLGPRFNLKPDPAAAVERPQVRRA